MAHREHQTDQPSDSFLGKRGYNSRISGRPSAAKIHVTAIDARRRLQSRCRKLAVATKFDVQATVILA